MNQAASAEFAEVTEITSTQFREAYKAAGSPGVKTARLVGCLWFCSQDKTFLKLYSTCEGTTYHQIDRVCNDFDDAYRTAVAAIRQRNDFTAA